MIKEVTQECTSQVMKEVSQKGRGNEITTKTVKSVTPSQETADEETQKRVRKKLSLRSKKNHRKNVKSYHFQFCKKLRYKVR